MSHTCHARRCTTTCRPEHLMCPRHWRAVPVKLRRAVLLYYRRGQCDDKRPSLDWHRAADAAIAAVAIGEGCPFGELRVCEARALWELVPELCPDDTGEKLAKIDAQRAKTQGEP